MQTQGYAHLSECGCKWGSTEFFSLDIFLCFKYSNVPLILFETRISRSLKKFLLSLFVLNILCWDFF